VIQTAQIVLPTGRLTASAVDTDRRTIEGILVPWGEVGQPAINGQGRKVSVRRGGLLLAEKVTGIDTHDRPAREVSTLVEHEVRAEGIWGRLRVDETPDGDALLGRVAAGERLGLSVEANGLLLDPTVDEVIGGTVDLVAHVDTPAFASARVHTMTAALSAVEPTTTAGEASHVTAPTTTTEAAPIEAAPALDYGQLAAALAPMLPPLFAAAAAPAGLPTGAMTPAADSGPAATDAVAQLATLQAAQAAGDTSMMAALADITNAALPIFQRPAGAIGEQLWQNHSFTRRFVPLLQHKDLTSYKFTSWEFTTGPEVDDWAGDKTPIPTNTIGPIREVEGVAQRLAGGWDIDRKYRDFGDAAFWTWFYAQQTESYARKSDGKALAALLAAVQPVDGTGTVPGLHPPGLGVRAAGAGRHPLRGRGGHRLPGGHPAGGEGPGLRADEHRRLAVAAEADEPGPAGVPVPAQRHPGQLPAVQQGARRVGDPRGEAGRGVLRAARRGPDPGRGAGRGPRRHRLRRVRLLGQPARAPRRRHLGAARLGRRLRAET
jgi:hypothetical protein